MIIPRIPEDWCLEITRIGGQINLEESFSNTAIRMSDLFKLPMNVYFQHPQGILLNGNEQTIMTMLGHSGSYHSTKKIFGTRFDKIFEKKSAEFLIQHDAEVIQKNKMIIFEDMVSRLDGLDMPFVSFKFPCHCPLYENPIIFGVSILLDKTVSPTAASLSEGLAMIFKLGLLSSGTQSHETSVFINKEIDGVYITTQQLKCMKLAILGMSAKQIAKELNLSFRTVEHHFENLKHKLKVHSKFELIQKFRPMIF